MCGIVGVVRRRSRREPPDVEVLVGELDQAVARLSEACERPGPRAVTEAANLIEAVDGALRGVPGVRVLLHDAGAASELELRASALQQLVDRLEVGLDTGDRVVTGDQLEALSAELIRVKDALWALRHDRLRTASAVGDLAGPGASVAALEAFTSVQIALSALDRLEVRGRDSAGLHVLVHGHGVALHEPGMAARIEARAGDPLFGSGSIRVTDGAFCFVYKVASEIGELGDNTKVLRAAIRADELLHDALRGDAAEAVVLGHTRWASVGIISEPNAHPLNHEEDGRDGAPYVVAALNGDVDNYVDLGDLEGLTVPTGITTDAKVIPALVSRRLAEGRDIDEAFRSTVAVLEGSVAVAASAVTDPSTLRLAVRGSGQGLYVGLAEDAFVVASEPYGLVEQASRYLRMDGEVAKDARRAGSSRGQVVVLDPARAGELGGIGRSGYDGTGWPAAERDLVRPEITTRDIDRGEAPHFLLKEITEAPSSFRKTLRGKIAETRAPGAPGSAPGLTAALPPGALPAAVAARIVDGSVGRVVVVGQGTAAVAGSSLAAALARATAGRLAIEAMPATELSGFGLRPDMRDTLVVAISQSGTTTDTNRTVDLARERGASVLSIVNRRNSDLVAKSDGVLYTADGRDVEMSVASTKAFYSQIAAGVLLAVAIGELLATTPPIWRDGVLAGLRALPDAMREVIDARSVIASIAQRHCPSRRSWAVVGNGANAIAAHELRIKLSELCYKAIACDVTEDKKHIDLSSEPLVVVCAAGLSGSVGDDVAKEVAIYRAHRAAPIVIATSGGGEFPAALDVIRVPSVHPELDFVLATVAGHLFSYEAALAIDASARPLREARAAVEAAVTGDPDGVLDRLSPDLEGRAQVFFDGLRAGQYDGSLEASTAVRLGSLLRYATGVIGLDSYELEHGKVGTPATVVEDLTAALTKAIEELTRPIDAIKHQAKTVTVGISRADEALLAIRLVQEVLAAGTPRDGLSYRAMRTLVALDPAVEQVTGFTRYRVEGDPTTDAATIHVVDRGGVAANLRSRTEDDPRLRGTKHRIATEREVTAVKGRADARTIVVVPELKHNQTVGLTLLHVEFTRSLAPDVMRGVLEGYQGRYAALRDAVTETEPTFDDTVLATVPVVDLLTEPINMLADRWRRG